MSSSIKALSLKQPWAWAICNLPESIAKKFENRSWNTQFRGAFLIHSSKSFDSVGYERMCGYLNQLGYVGDIPTKKEFVYGALIGKTELIDVVQESDDIWFEGKYGFKLINTIAFNEPITYKGQLNFFKVNYELVSEQIEQHSIKVKMITGTKEKLAYIKEAKKNDSTLLKVIIKPDKIKNSIYDASDLYLKISNLRTKKNFFKIPYVQYLIDNNWDHLAFYLNTKLENFVEIFDIYDERIVELSKAEATIKLMEISYE